MTIFVDPIGKWPTTIRCFKPGSCHMMTDAEDLDELHEFARRVGLKRAWFQDHPTLPHYDLTIGRRARAVQLGATEVDRRGMARIMAKRKGLI